MSKYKKPKKISYQKIVNFFIKKGLKDLVDESKKRELSVNEMKVKSPYKPDLDDLYRLYFYD